MMGTTATRANGWRGHWGRSSVLPTTTTAHRRTGLLDAARSLIRSALPDACDGAIDRLVRPIAAASTSLKPVHPLAPDVDV